MTNGLTYLLRQETPMIHFQAKETGVTLRATDVKPRLDKFLIELMTDEQHKQLKRDPDHDALNYKMHFASSGSAKISSQIASSYFGNMGIRDENEKKSTIKTDAVIELCIVCFIPELCDLIDQNIEAFFLLHNFGTRNDKGFGSFSIVKRNHENLICDSKHVGVILREYAQRYKAAHEEKLNFVVYHIDDRESITQKGKSGQLDGYDVLYKLIKSGINNSKQGVYIKSYLTEYMLGKGIGGEKRWMKREGIGPAIKSSPLEERAHGNLSDYRYIRAVLGLTDRQEWQNENAPKTKIEISYCGKEKNPQDEKVLSRFQSPITFSVYGGQGYLIAFDPNPIIFDKEFQFISNRGKGILKTPEDFDMKEFMKYCAEKVNQQSIFAYFGGAQYKFTLEEVGV